MPNPADTNWRVRSDSQYVGKTAQNHPLKLTDDQAISQADLPTAISYQGPSFEACPSRMVFQRTVIRSVNRYKLGNTKIVAESAHTVQISIGSMLRKSGVAIRKSNTPKN